MSKGKKKIIEIDDDELNFLPSLLTESLTHIRDCLGGRLLRFLLCLVKVVVVTLLIQSKC